LPEPVKSEYEFFAVMMNYKLNFIDLSLLKRLLLPNFKANFNTWYQGHHFSIQQLIIDTQPALEMLQCKN